jgi:hypothetical protein
MDMIDDTAFFSSPQGFKKTLRGDYQPYIIIFNLFNIYINIMNKEVKYIFFFFIGIISYYLLFNDRLVEGLENDPSPSWRHQGNCVTQVGDHNDMGCQEEGESNVCATMPLYKDKLACIKAKEGYTIVGGVAFHDAQAQAIEFTSCTEDATATGGAIVNADATACTDVTIVGSEAIDNMSRAINDIDFTATCTETAVYEGGASVPNDETACSEVNALENATACEEVLKSDDSSEKACTYTVNVHAGPDFIPPCTNYQEFQPWIKAVDDLCCSDHPERCEQVRGVQRGRNLPVPHTPAVPHQPADLRHNWPEVVAAPAVWHQCSPNCSNVMRKMKNQCLVTDRWMGEWAGRNPDIGFDTKITAAAGNCEANCGNTHGANRDPVIPTCPPGKHAADPATPCVNCSPEECCTACTTQGLDGTPATGCNKESENICATRAGYDDKLACTTASSGYTLDGGVAIANGTCTSPGPVEGYNITGEVEGTPVDGNWVPPTGVVCDTGYSGTVTYTPCTTAGGVYTLGGCEANTCANTDGKGTVATCETGRYTKDGSTVCINCANECCPKCTTQGSVVPPRNAPGCFMENSNRCATKDGFEKKLACSRAVREGYHLDGGVAITASEWRDLPCRTPTSVEGYDFSGEVGGTLEPAPNWVAPTGVVCDTGYSGTVAYTPCVAAGGTKNYTVSGCTADTGDDSGGGVVTCTSPTTTGYDNANEVGGTQVAGENWVPPTGVVCDTGYSGDVTYTACTKTGEPYTLSGCVSSGGTSKQKCSDGNFNNSALCTAAIPGNIYDTSKGSYECQDASCTAVECCKKEDDEDDEGDEGDEEEEEDNIMIKIIAVIGIIFCMALLWFVLKKSSPSKS